MRILPIGTVNHFKGLQYFSLIDAMAQWHNNGCNVGSNPCSMQGLNELLNKPKIPFLSNIMWTLFLSFNSSVSLFLLPLYRLPFKYSGHPLFKKICKLHLINYVRFNWNFFKFQDIIADIWMNCDECGNLFPVS